MATLKIYSKDQTDALLANKADASALPAASQLVPSTSGASNGDVLTFDGSTIGWAAGGGGSGGGMEAHTYQTLEALTTAYREHGGIIVIKNIPRPSYTQYKYSGIASVIDTGGNAIALSLSKIDANNPIQGSTTSGTFNIIGINIQNKSFNGVTSIYYTFSEMVYSHTIGNEITPSSNKISSQYAKLLSTIGDLETIVTHYY